MKRPSKPNPPSRPDKDGIERGNSVIDFPKIVSLDMLEKIRRENNADDVWIEFDQDYWVSSAYTVTECWERAKSQQEIDAENEAYQAALTEHMQKLAQYKIDMAAYEEFSKKRGIEKLDALARLKGQT